ncbi:MAG: molybdopterin-dependent oxidoreductase, partial [Vulcanisaeta sp.]
MSTSYVRTICPFCGVGCGLVLEVRDGEVVRVFGEKEHVLSKGRLCGKGASSIRSLYSKDRIIYPLKRVGDNFITIGYDDAIKEITKKLLDIRDRYGGKSIAIFGGCQNTLEETYIMGKLARFLGSNNVDSCARICHEPSAMALRETVGIGGSGVSVEEVPRAKVIVIAGESITESHPVLVDYFLEAKRNGAKIIVIDPRVTPTVRLLADMHLQINQGTDIYLFNAVANYLIQSGKYDKEFVESRTKGFEEYREVVRDYSIEDAEKITGIPKDEIVRFAELITTKPTIFSWGLGLSEGGGVNAVRAYLDLMLLTGNVGIDGGGPLVFRGQSNVQGSGDLLKPNRFPNGDINEKNARKLAGVWGFEPPLYKGLTVTDTFLRDNDIKAVILFNFNVVHSLPNRDRVIKKLKELEL